MVNGLAAWSVVVVTVQLAPLGAASLDPAVPSRCVVEKGIEIRWLPFCSSLHSVYEWEAKECIC